MLLEMCFAVLVTKIQQVDRAGPWQEPLGRHSGCHTHQSLDRPRLPSPGAQQPRQILQDRAQEMAAHQGQLGFGLCVGSALEAYSSLNGNTSDCAQLHQLRVKGLLQGRKADIADQGMGENPKQRQAREYTLSEYGIKRPFEGHCRFRSVPGQAGEQPVFACAGAAGGLLGVCGLAQWLHQAGCSVLFKKSACPASPVNRNVHVNSGYEAGNCFFPTTKTGKP